jgi:hypothetical protein
MVPDRAQRVLGRQAVLNHTDLTYNNSDFVMDLLPLRIQQNMLVNSTKCSQKRLLEKKTEKEGGRVALSVLVYPASRLFT